MNNYIDPIWLYENVKEQMPEHAEDIKNLMLVAPGVKVPPYPKSDMIGYKWKLKWVLEPHPTFTKMFIQGANDESS